MGLRQVLEKLGQDKLTHADVLGLLHEPVLPALPLLEQDEEEGVEQGQEGEQEAA